MKKVGVTKVITMPTETVRKAEGKQKKSAFRALLEKCSQSSNSEK